MFSRRPVLALLCAPLFMLSACSEADVAENKDGTGAATPAATGIAALGAGTHDRDSVQWDVIGNADDGLATPRDFDFNPYTEGELWVVNRKDDSVVRFNNVGTAEQTSDRRVDAFAEHFMEEVSAISFSATETYKDGAIFGTCQESNNTYNDKAMGNGFMGPALWTSDWEVFGFNNPEAVTAIGDKLGSHLDMMHESPFCMGLGWETKNVYWTVDGQDQTISRYDFAEHHFPGYDDHSDGTVTRYMDVEYTRVPDVPSHIVYSPSEQAVYYNDTGTGRVLRFDPAAAVMGKDRSKRSMDHGVFHHMNGGELTVVASADTAVGMQNPSGLTLAGDVLYVTDNATSTIFAIKTDGTVIDWLETGLPAGSLMGVRVDPEGSVWFVDAEANELVRLRAKAAP